MTKNEVAEYWNRLAGFSKGIIILERIKDKAPQYLTKGGWNVDFDLLPVEVQDALFEEIPKILMEIEEENKKRRDYLIKNDEKIKEIVRYIEDLSYNPLKLWTGREVKGDVFYSDIDRVVKSFIGKSKFAHDVYSEVVRRLEEDNFYVHS